VTTVGTVGNVLVLLGTIVTACGLLYTWSRNAPPSKSPVQSISATGIPSGEAFGTPTITQERGPSHWTTWARRAKLWARFGRPVHHTADAHVIVAPTITATARMPAPHIGTEAARVARVEQAIDALTEQHASAAEDLRRDAELIKQEFNDYRAAVRADTRRQTLITGIGAALTIAGVVLLILAG
jgi:hypothetical protein